MKEFLQQKLHNIKRANLYRELQASQPSSPTHREIDGQSLLQFYSNDYLGLSQDERLLEAAYQAAQVFGVGATGSRLISGHNQLQAELENKLAEFKEQEAALFFSSGYLAGLGCISALVGPNDLILADELNHSNLINGAKLSGAQTQLYPHLNYQVLEKLLEEKRQTARHLLIVSDYIFSMDGDQADPKVLLALAQKYNAWLMLDEAHAVSSFALQADCLIRMGTCSKALGVQGGFIAGSHLLIEFLKQRAKTFIYSTACSPLVVGALLQSLQIIKQESWRINKLNENASLLKNGCQAADFKLISGASHIICLELKSEAEVLNYAEFLQKQGILVSAIRKPTTGSAPNLANKSQGSRILPLDLLIF